MFRKKYNLSGTDYRVILVSPVRLRNLLIQEGRFTDSVDKLISKISSVTMYK